MMTEKEELNFTRSGVIRIYEKMMAGEMTEEDFHRAAANTEAILKADGISDITVRYMGIPEERTWDSILLSLAERGLDVKDFIKFRPKLRQTKFGE